MFEEWLPTDAVWWLAQDSVASVDIFQNDTGFSPEMRFVFGVETLEDWLPFVNRDEHQVAIEDFKTFADNREEYL